MNELYPVLKQLWLVWLVLLFAAIVAWTFWPGRRKELERHARIPFDGEDPSNAP